MSGWLGKLKKEGLELRDKIQDKGEKVKEELKRIDTMEDAKVQLIHKK
jgi:hypothetical protein